MLSQYLAEETKENHKKPVCITTGVPAEIKTKMNTNLECSCYTTLTAFVLYVNSKKIINFQLCNSFPCSLKVTRRESVKFHVYVNQVTMNKPQSPTANKP